MAKIVKELGKEAFGPLMGKVMSKVRGRAEVKTVSTMLREKIQRKM
ncbi:MAG: hypothetical protein QXL67_04880 [Candidatus Bathyarchaeia archaeon]